jgi:NAD(P)-dependent dehydrogenase (short-subunit alcohol dehydrogenase family)
MILKNKTVLITGASRGLGKKIAEAFLQAGAHLILVARDIKKLTLLQEELQKDLKENQTIRLLAVDLAKPEELKTLFDLTNIDILINNAAVQGPIGAIWENDWQSWQTTQQINLLSPVALCRALIPQMMKQNFGRIINISGGGATNARPQFSAYAVSKTALVRFSETLAEEVKSFNISVNCIAPGVMNTDMLQEVLQAGEEKIGKKEFANLTNKMRGDDSVMQNAAELCVYLASFAHNDISGKLISAVWDPWKKLTEHKADLTDSDIFTLRRIVPGDRGKTWSDVT